MKKITVLMLVLISLCTLSGCRGIRERLLAPPDEIDIPDGSFVASCIVDEVEYRYVYQNDGVYQYFIDNVLQDDTELDTIQEQAFLHGESVENYLIDEYGQEGCDILEYIDDHE